MRISDYRGDDALDLLADILEPAAEIMQDKEVSETFRNKTMLLAAKTAIKNHKGAVIEIMARLEGKDPTEYGRGITVFTLPIKVLEILNDPGMQDLFTLQGQRTENTPSGPAMESTEGENE